MSEMTSGLVERIEAAIGPDLQLDADIRCALFAPNGAYVEQSKFNGAWCVYEVGYNGKARSWEGRGLSDEHRRGSFTGSIDAAMTLVPEGMRLMLSEWDDEKHLRPQGPWQAVLSKPGCDPSFAAMVGHRCDHAATPALAICAAALRARAPLPAPPAKDTI